MKVLELINNNNCKVEIENQIMTHSRIEKYFNINRAIKN
jgi:hypothetical protein